MTSRELKQIAKASVHEIRRVIENTLEDIVHILDQLYYPVSSFLLASWKIIWQPMNDFLVDPVNSMLMVWFLVLLAYIFLT